jgi:hypothetical protein
MLSYVLPEQSRRQLDWLTKALRMAIDDLGVDGRHDILMPRSGATFWHMAWIAALLSARLARACRPRGWPARRLR